MKKNLEKKVKSAARKHRLNTAAEREEVFSFLNRKLAELERDGEVVSLLVYDGHGKINCYGKRIPEEIIFGKLNLSMMTEGTKVTSHGSYPELHRLISYRQGYFVSGRAFNLPENDYVALVNIRLDPEQEAFPYRSFSHKTL